MTRYRAGCSGRALKECATSCRSRKVNKFDQLLVSLSPCPRSCTSIALTLYSTQLRNVSVPELRRLLKRRSWRSLSFSRRQRCFVRYSPQNTYISMSTRVHASRSHHNLRSEPSSSRVAHPSHAGEPHKYGHRQPGGGHRQQVSEPARSLRTVASSSRLPRQVYRDDMPPPPVPSPRKRLPPAPAPDRMHPARSHMESHEHHQRLPSIPYQPPPASRLETYDRVPSHRPPRSAREPGAAPRLELSRNDDHEVVLSRMRQNGWQGVGGKRHGSDDAMSQRSLSSSSLTPSERDNQPHASSAGLAKVDSGYADEIDGVEDKTAGEKVLEGWSALKKAVAGLASEGSASHGQGEAIVEPRCSKPNLRRALIGGSYRLRTGAQMWNRLTTTLAASVGTAQDAWNAEDDGSVGPDGETKLGRAIKSSVSSLSLFDASRSTLGFLTRERTHLSDITCLASSRPKTCQSGS